MGTMIEIVKLKVQNRLKLKFRSLHVVVCCSNSNSLKLLQLLMFKIGRTLTAIVLGGEGACLSKAQ